MREPQVERRAPDDVGRDEGRRDGQRRVVLGELGRGADHARRWGPVVLREQDEAVQVNRPVDDRQDALDGTGQRVVVVAHLPDPRRAPDLQAAQQVRVGAEVHAPPPVLHPRRNVREVLADVGEARALGVVVGDDDLDAVGELRCERGQQAAEGVPLVGGDVDAERRVDGVVADPRGRQRFYGPVLLGDHRVERGPPVLGVDRVGVEVGDDVVALRLRPATPTGVGRLERVHDGGDVGDGPVRGLRVVVPELPGRQPGILGDKLRLTGEVVHDGGRAARARLGDGQAEALAVGGREQDVGRGVDRRHRLVRDARMRGPLVDDAELVRLKADDVDEGVEVDAAVLAVALGVDVEPRVIVALGEDAERPKVLVPRLAVDVAAGLVGVDARHDEVVVALLAEAHELAARHLAVSVVPRLGGAVQVRIDGHRDIEGVDARAANLLLRELRRGEWGHVRLGEECAHRRREREVVHHRPDAHGHPIPRRTLERPRIEQGEEQRREVGVLRGPVLEGRLDDVVGVAVHAHRVVRDALKDGLHRLEAVVGSDRHLVPVSGEVVDHLPRLGPVAGLGPHRVGEPRDRGGVGRQSRTLGTAALGSIHCRGVLCRDWRRGAG